MASENPEEPIQQLVTIKPTFSFHVGGPMIVGLPDVGIDDLHVRNIVTRLANNIQNSFTTQWSEQVVQACDAFDLKNPNGAAKMLVDLGWFLPRIPYDYVLVQRISRIARHSRVNVDYRVKIWASIILLYQQAEEWSLVREAAQQLYELSVSKKRFASAATALTTIAQGHMYENHPNLARSAYADALRTCSDHELFKETLWAYHNLGLLEWREGNKEQAFIEWERELRARASTPGTETAQCMCFTAAKYEQFDQQRATELYMLAVTNLEAENGLDANLLRAEAAYRLAVLLLDRKEWQQAIQCADVALTCFSKLVQHEHRLAWCHQVKAIACDAQGDEAGTLASRSETERLLVLWGQDSDRFRMLLAQALEATSDEDWSTRLKEAEHSAFSLGAEARIVWSVAVAAHYAAKADRTAALEHLMQGILLEKEVQAWTDAQTPVFLHLIAAELFAAEGHRSDALAHAQAAYNLDASDYWIALLL